MKTLKERLDAKSKERDDGGVIHHGWVHYIQGKSTDGEGGFDGFNLKAAIYSVVEAVPEFFPEELPELVEKEEEYKPTQKTIDKAKEINEHLLLPLQGYDIVNIIKWAKEYLAL